MHDFRTSWGFALISIVFVTWLLFRYLAPRHRREWVRAGIVQAFIIAFYAEMYGFPITLYALTRLLGLDVEGQAWRDNLWAYLTGSEAMMVVTMIIGYAISISGVLLVIRGWRRLYHAAREHRLATDGPYAIVRHPQYLGLFMAVFGEGVVHWPTIFSLAAFPVIVLAYVLLARREERQVSEEHARAYADYRRRVPMFIPRPGAWGALFAGGRTPRPST